MLVQVKKGIRLTTGWVVLIQMEMVTPMVMAPGRLTMEPTSFQMTQLSGKTVILMDMATIKSAITSTLVLRNGVTHGVTTL